MQNTSLGKIILLLLMAVSVVSCMDSKQKENKDKKVTVQQADMIVPPFNADSAYSFVESQLNFGPRVPNTEAHTACAEYLASTLKRYADSVIVQHFKARAYDGNVLNGRNIIASFDPGRNGRVLLCAHWDSRPYADHDPDPANHDSPILGANDGASGVGVLLEIARQLKTQRPRIGVDIILFDAEDYGPPSDTQQHDETDYWGLGSQYWAKNPHVFNYRARFAILLDMVGVSKPSFLMEGFSMHFAPDKVKKVWNIAHELGYEEYFPQQPGGYITDDHYYINQYRKIPAINIIHLDDESPNGSFFPHWHTLEDNLEHVDKGSLNIVGNTVLAVLFRE
jgi:Zn-dependent M28 family amino/carboxypeptidase